VLTRRSLLFLAALLQAAILAGCSVTSPDEAVSDPQTPPADDGDDLPAWSTWLDQADMLAGQVFHLDPQTGSLTNPGTAAAPWPGLEAVVQAGYVQRWSTEEKPYPSGGAADVVCLNPEAPVGPGDRLVLHAGDHGDVVLRDMHQPGFVKISGAAGEQPRLGSLLMHGVERVVVEDVILRSRRTAGDQDADRCLLVADDTDWFGPSGYILVRNCRLESDLSSSGWTADDWVANARNGVVLRCDDVAVMDNALANVYFGINVIGDRAVVRGNAIDHFAADGIQAMGSDLLLQGNVIRDAYKVDDNHDDGIQCYPFGDQAACRNVVIRGNTIVARTGEPNLLTDRLHGIVLTSEGYVDCVIENNLVVVDAWMGILVRGGTGVSVVNNTLTGVDEMVEFGPPMVMIEPGLDGLRSTGIVVRNNIAWEVRAEGDVAADHNLTGFDPEAVFVAPWSGDYRARVGGPARDAGSADGAPAEDIAGRARPGGGAVDIGAFEL
jgi:hypothetical protein